MEPVKKRMRRRGTTHFLSLPFILSPVAKKNNQTLVTSIPKEYQEFVYDKPHHATLFVLNLHSESQLKKTIELLDGLQPEIVKYLESLKVIKGIIFYFF